MFEFLSALCESFKGHHVADASLDFEAELIARDAERKAVLLRRAARYDDESLHEIAQELRHRANAISLQHPLACVTPKEQTNEVVCDNSAPIQSKPVERIVGTGGNGEQNRIPDPKKRK